MQKLIFFFIVFGNCFPLTYSQNFESDLKAMYEAYKAVDKFSTNISIRADLLNEKTINQKAWIKKDGDNYKYSIDSRILLCNDKYLITVDNYDESIIVAGVDLDNSKLDIIGVEQIEAMYEKLDSVSFMGEDGLSKRYVVYTPNSQTTTVEIFINKKTFLLDKVVYNYNTSTGIDTKKVVIQYNDVNLSPVFKKDEFSEANFITKSKGEFIPVIEYKGFNIINITK